MTPEKVKHSLRRLRGRLASKHRRHLALLRMHAARWRATASWMGHPQLAAVVLESRHGSRRLPTRQELRMEAEFRDAIRDLKKI